MGQEWVISIETLQLRIANVIKEFPKDKGELTERQTYACTF